MMQDSPPPTKRSSKHPTINKNKDFASAMSTPLASIGLSMHPLIQLRWIAVIGQIATIVFVHFVFGMDLPLPIMAVVLTCLIAFNLISTWRWRHRDEVTNGSLFFALLVDVSTLTAQLYLSGGASNPFVFLYLLQVVLGAVMLRAWASWTIAAITTACFISLMIWAGPVVIPATHYTSGLLICFVLNAALLVAFVNRISRILRARDARLASLRQRAVEEEHIVRMGLLASGAAHELGTPLATISVILGDWKRMPTFTANPDLSEDLGEIQIQLNRCKSIVTGILLSAGEMRAESPVQTTVKTFLDDLVTSWRATRTISNFTYTNRFENDVTIVSDEGLKQMISNVLDNGLEASPGWLEFDVSRDGGDLVLRVNDRGPGFESAILANFGRPYQSSKGRPGGGLGLFLSLNVARALGGNIVAVNRESGGATVTMTLPLASLILEEESEKNER